MQEFQSLEHLIKQLEFNYIYLLDLVKDIEEKDMAFTPSKGLENHPTFTLGHLITAYGLTTKYLGGKYTVKKEWDDIFRRNGPGDPRFPTLDKNLYPTKNELILELENQHNILLNYHPKPKKEPLWVPCYLSLLFSTHILVTKQYSLVQMRMHGTHVCIWIHRFS